MKIEQIPIEKLIEYANNAKLHSDDQISKIAASIKEFGFNNPMLIDADNGIVAGHGRLLAAKKLEMKSVPCIRLSHLSEAQKKAYILADNRLAEIGGGWNEELLKLEIDFLKENDFDIDLTGFNIGDIKVFEAEEVEPPELKEGDREPFRQVTFTLHDSQFDELEKALKTAKERGCQSEVNENSNGNALHYIAEKFNNE